MKSLKIIALSTVFFLTACNKKNTACVCDDITPPSNAAAPSKSVSLHGDKSLAEHFLATSEGLFCKTGALRTGTICEITPSATDKNTVTIGWYKPTTKEVLQLTETEQPDGSWQRRDNSVMYYDKGGKGVTIAQTDDDFITMVFNSWMLQYEYDHNKL